MVLLRSDGTPTYMLAVVVDDHDMGVTHVIRGDDHLNNAARQTLIYHAMGWAGAGLGAYPADPRRGRQEAVEAARRAGRRGIAGDGLSGGRDAQLPRPARLEPRRRRVLHRRAGEGMVRPRRHRPGARAARPQEAASTSLASISPRWTTPRLLDEIEAYLRGSGLRAARRATGGLRLGQAMYCLKDRAKTWPELLEKAHFALTERPVAPGRAGREGARRCIRVVYWRIDAAAAKC